MLFNTFCVFLFCCFSSRRRHTRFSRDWSSDVCSSDLAMRPDTWPMFANPAIWGFFFEGLRETIYLAVVSIAIAFVVGMLFALGRLSRRRWIRWPCIFYIEGVRALPVLLLIVYFNFRGSALFHPFFSLLGLDFDLP